MTNAQQLRDAKYHVAHTTHKHRDVLVALRTLYALDLSIVYTNEYIAKGLDAIVEALDDWDEATSKFMVAPTD